MNPEQKKSLSKEDLIESGEVIVDVIYRHWMGLGYIFVAAFTCLFAIVVLVTLSFTDLQNSTSGESMKLIMGLGILVIGISGFMMFLISWIYRQSQIILTDKSLVYVTQNGLFNRKISRLSMSNLEDVSSEQRGILPTMFNYGTLTVQTAGEQDNFIFPFCPRPNKYAEEMLEARQKYADSHLVSVG